ncbi:UDP-N-acetylmuramoyl-tripeptide--D-alanyl-D-alanine ligase [Candidatus Parcubacteria bacterium]|nr:UDP-N-acetylmuramoyl-tripeptide--D-alanyl-D-alanine ligase [Candidatus Parcubacteria bacterium]
MKSFFKRAIVGILTWEAKKVLRKYNPKIVGVTGSVGKTSTKDAIYTVLASNFHTRKSDKSFNSELGVPLTILGLPNAWSNPLLWLRNIIQGFFLILSKHSYPQWLVLEIGADAPGDIETLTTWLKPDVAVLTRFGDVPVHIEFFPTIDDLINEKGYLAHALKKDGVLVLNHDDEKVFAFGERVNHRKISYGFDSGAHVHADQEKVTYGPYDHTDLELPHGMAFMLNYEGKSQLLEVNGTIGKQHIYPILAAFAVGISQGIPAEKMHESLKKHTTPRGRMKLVAGLKDTLLIDDTYNSSPVAVHAALHALKSLKCAGRKIAVLADMMELGQYSVEEHKKVGTAVPDAAQMLVAVGFRSRTTAEAALDAGMSELNVLQFDTSTEAGKYVESIIKSGDIILVKGSQSMRMERVVEEIMAHPEKARDLLVRQDKQWKAKK